MKKLILILLTIISTLSLAEVVNTQNIAVVDTSIVLEQYNKRTQLEDELDLQKKEYDVVLQQHKEEILKKELELVQMGDKVSNTNLSELNDLKGEIENKFKQFDNNLNKLYSDYMYQLNSDIATAAVVVGRERGFDIVFHKGTTFYGGTDITNEVIDFLNKGEKISLFQEDMNTINNDTYKYKN